MSVLAAATVKQTPLRRALLTLMLCGTLASAGYLATVLFERPAPQLGRVPRRVR